MWALADWDDSYGPWLLAGSALYLAGPVGLTMTYHVPRNNALDTAGFVLITLAAVD